MRWLVLLTFLPLFFSYPFVTKRVDWRPWMTFGIASVLLLCPRTEVFTYVLLAPSYVLVVARCMESDNRALKNYGPCFFTLLALLIASCAYINAEWMALEKPFQSLRVIGTFSFWLATGIILVQELRSGRNNPVEPPLDAN